MQTKQFENCVTLKYKFLYLLTPRERSKWKFLDLWKFVGERLLYKLMGLSIISHYFWFVPDSWYNLRQISKSCSPVSFFRICIDCKRNISGFWSDRAIKNVPPLPPNWQSQSLHLLNYPTKQGCQAPQALNSCGLYYPSISVFSIEYLNFEFLYWISTKFSRRFELGKLLYSWYFALGLWNIT